MWGMEYNPNIFTKYEDPDGAKTKAPTTAVNNKVLQQYGKFERKIVKTGRTEENSALAIFLVASVLETKNKRILTEAKGVDDVVKVLSFFPSLTYTCAYMLCSCIAFLHVSHMKLSLQILGDITSSLDAKKACKEALKIQEKYLNKVISFLLNFLFYAFLVSV